MQERLGARPKPGLRERPRPNATAWAPCGMVNGIPDDGVVRRRRPRCARHAPRCMAVGHMLGKKFPQPRTEQTPSQKQNGIPPNRSTTQQRSRKQKNCPWEHHEQDLM